MNKIINYKNKDVGVLGLGLSGQSATKVLLNSNARVFIYDDHVHKPNSLENSIWMDFKKWPWKSLKALVVSPGIPINSKTEHQAITLAKKYNVKITNDIELFLNTKPKAKILGITGTNGKSTTVALLNHILLKNNIRCEIGGNFGLPACEINDPGNNGVILLELSSYQLDGTNTLTLDAVSIINITPDHLDFHECFENYKASKFKILEFLKTDGTLVLDKNITYLKEIKKIIKNHKVRLIEVSKQNGKKFLKKNSNLNGDHNYINVAIATTLAKCLGINDDKIKFAMESFKGLPHRLELVFNSPKIKIFNDSKSTNGESTAAALKSFRNIFWIVGGKPKSDGIGASKKYLKHVHEVFLIGKFSSFFLKEISKYSNKIPITECYTLEKASKLALQKAYKTKLKEVIILLSPSAASFDQFKNFEDRGEKFREIIKGSLNQERVEC